MHRNYGFAYPDDVATLFAAQSVKTPAAPYDPDRLKRILAQGKTRGGKRLMLYMLLGLLLGYTQGDCCQISIADYLQEETSVFIHRFRSKEKRPKRGSRPIRVKHWIPPELVALIESERGNNVENFLFNSERGTVLKAKSVANIWDDATADADEKLSFKQLRKIGFNRIKHHSGSREVADLWDGHAAGVTDNYDDGIFQPVIETQKKFAAELRNAGLFDG